MGTAFHSLGQSIKPIQSGLAPVNGNKIYYEVYGQGKPVILLHGAFMTINTNWAEIIPELSKTRKVIAIEFQGHGHTPYAERTLSFPVLASDVEGVMNYLKVDSAAVIGYSMGGSVAYQLAIQNPKRVTTLVIISATYKTNGWMAEVNNAFKDLKPELFANSPMREAYDAVAPDKTKWTKFIDQMITFIKVPYDLGDTNIGKIKLPVLLVAGDNDGLDKFELIKTYRLLGGDVFADFKGVPPSQLAIVPSQGHVSVMMQTSTILNYLGGFLK
jgi:pimeloyl-ACP methyl ester carboxylesterase